MILEKMEIQVKEYQRTVGIEELNDNYLIATLSGRRIKWLYKEEHSPRGVASDNWTRAGLLSAVPFILKRLSLDNIKIDYISTKPKQVATNAKKESTVPSMVYKLSEKEYLEIYVNNYIRGFLNEVGHFAWNVAKYPDTFIPLDVRGKTGSYQTASSSDVIKDSLRKKGFTSLNDIKNNIVGVPGTIEVFDEAVLTRHIDLANKIAEEAGIASLVKSDIEKFIKTKNVKKIIKYAEAMKAIGYNENVINAIARIAECCK